MAGKLSTKRIQIDKANARMVIAIGVASFVAVFSLVSMKALYSQMKYQNKVSSEKQKAVSQLKKNVDASKTLVESFKTFSEAPSLLGTSDNNAKIVLDALPSKYDFPALAASLEKILTSGGYEIESITGTDDEANQAITSPNGAGQIEMPFTISASSNYQAVQKLIADFERSIRPFYIDNLELSGNDGNIKINMIAKTFYQPEKSLEIKTKEVK